MLENMDSMEAGCVIYVKVGMLNYLEHSQIWLVTVNQMGIVRLTVQHNLIDTVCFMDHPRDCLRQISADIISLEEFPISI
jgi:hypothetical protein